MPEDRARSFASGATDYIAKPVDTEELLSCMERCLGRAVAGGDSSPWR
jgi:DNA-binding response OmpR family regulator